MVLKCESLMILNCVCGLWNMTNAQKFFRLECQFSTTLRVFLHSFTIKEVHDIGSIITIDLTEMQLVPTSEKTSENWKDVKWPPSCRNVYCSCMKSLHKQINNRMRWTRLTVQKIYATTEVLFVFGSSRNKIVWFRVLLHLHCIPNIIMLTV